MTVLAELRRLLRKPGRIEQVPASHSSTAIGPVASA